MKKTCKLCNTPVKRNDRIYCSRKCANSDPNKKLKSIQTNLKKYGVEYYLQTTEIHEKRKSTNLKRYGTEHHLQNKEILQKQKQTNLKRYGFECTLQNDNIKEKRRLTWLKKYGVEHPLQNKKIQDKKNQTMIEKYGVENPQHIPEIQEKIKLTNIKKYGVSHHLQNQDILRKQKQTNLQRYGVTNVKYKHNPASFDLLLDYDWLYDQYINQLKTATQIALDLKIDTSTICKHLHQQDILMRRIGAFSYKAIVWLDWVSQKENIFIQHAGNIGEYIIPNTKYLADGYCEETNTIYEFHGDMWHGNPELYSTEEHCHPFNSDIAAGELYQKTIDRENEIKELGYNLVTIWENEWIIIDK